MASSWLLLSFTIPSKPSAPRLYIWRKLKRLGALLLHNAVWALPANARTREQLQWLAAEIDELGGEAMLWEAQTGRDEALRRHFTAQVEAAYREILKNLEKGGDPAALSQHYQQAQLSDHFQAPLGQRVREALIAARSAA
ncbi:MAG: Chromate resistance protein ChrB, partial [Anaerolineales bacterium]